MSNVGAEVKYLSREELTPLENPGLMWPTAIDDLSQKSEDWMIHYEACNIIRRANQNHPELFSGGKASEVSAVLIKTADSLRS